MLQQLFKLQALQNYGAWGGHCETNFSIIFEKAGTVVFVGVYLQVETPAAQLSCNQYNAGNM